MRAAYAGDAHALVALLAEDATITTDGGAEGRGTAGFRNLTEPLRGAMHVASFVVMATRRGGVALTSEIRDVNGLPALILRSADGPFAVITLGIAGDRIERVYFHADLSRLDHV